MVSGRAPGRRCLTAPHRAALLRELDALSRTRALTDAESRRLERLLHADYCSRLRQDRPILRSVGR